MKPYLCNENKFNIYSFSVEFHLLTNTFTDSFQIYTTRNVWWTQCVKYLCITKNYLFTIFNFKAQQILYCFICGKRHMPRNDFVNFVLKIDFIINIVSKCHYTISRTFKRFSGDPYYSAFLWNNTDICYIIYDWYIKVSLCLHKRNDLPMNGIIQTISY